MSLRKYRYFITIVDAGSLTKAAALLHVAQPALTQQLQSIESEVGVQLLERTPRGVRPTDAGQLFYERAGMILRLADSIRRDVGHLHEHPAGEVSLGIPSSMALMLAVPILESVRARYPDIRLRILTGISGHLEDLLDTGRLDLTVLFQPSRDNLVIEWLFEEAMYLMAPPDVAIPDPFPLKRIPDYPMILPSRNFGVRQLLDDVFARHGIVPNVIAELDGSIPTTNTLVHRGQGCSIMTWATMATDVKAGRLRSARLSPSVRRSVALARSRDVPLPHRALVVYRLVRQTILDEALALGPAAGIRILAASPPRRHKKNPKSD